MEEKRFLSKIRMENDKLIRFEFSNNGVKESYCIHSDVIEAIKFRNGSIIVCPCNSMNNRDVLDATKMDFEELKSVIKTSSQYVTCGENNIFCIEHVISFSESKAEENVMFVDCREDQHVARLKSKEEAKEFLMAIQKKWKKMFTEWDQTREISISD